MKNIKLIVLAIVAALSTSVWAQKTYTFDDGVALENDWNVELTGEGLTCQITNNIGGSLTTKDGNYLGLAFTKSNTTITVTTKAKYTNITSIGIDLSSSDNSKPSYSGYIVDDSGNVVETLFENIDSKTSFATGGARKWGHKDVSVSTKTGYFKLSATTGSSGKYTAIDNITITYSGGGETSASSDATLKNIVYGADETLLPGFASDKLDYTLELAKGYVGMPPTVKGIPNDTKATVSYNLATTLSETSYINVTAEDGTTKKQYSVAFTIASDDTIAPVDPTPGENENLLIKGTTQQEASGPAAGSVVTNLSKKSSVKLDKSKYFGLSLQEGYTLEEGDIFVINITTAADLGKCMLYADKDGNELLYDEGVEYTKPDAATPVICPTGEKRILLPAAVAGKTAIYLWRENGVTQWNPTFDYIAVYRNGEIPGPAAIAVTGVTLDKATEEVEIGKTVTLTAAVAPSNATNKDVTWSSANTAVATVANGVVTGVAEGEANIIVETVDGGFKDSCKVTVKKKSEPVDPPTPSGNSIFDWIIAGSSKIENDETDLSQANYGTLNVGTSVTGRILGENPIEYNTKGYKLANNDVCIEIQGTSAFQAGDIVTITGVCGGSGERGFTVAPSSSASASSGDILLTNLIESTEVNNFTATITNNQAGEKLRIFRLAGKTMYLSAIKVERSDSTPTPPVEPVVVESVSLNKKTLTLEAGQTETLTATVKPDNADNKKISWESDNTTVATVDATGKVSALTAGTAKIIVTTEDQGKTDTCVLTVTTPATVIEVESISIKTATSLKIGESETLSVTYTPANANTGKAITWTSDKKAIATVDTDGKVTGVAAGTAAITATTENGKTASCTVTVEKASPVPPTALLIHEPEKYEAKEMEGGYSTPLVNINNREYEVYYTERTKDGDYPTFSTTPVTDGKTTGISGSTTKSKNVGRPGDTWFEGTIYSHSECKSASTEDEFTFESKMIREHRLGATDTYQFHVKGFDQFSLWGMDKKIDPKNGNQVFVVKVDGKEQPTDESLYNKDNYTIRRYDITTDEHLIEISTTCTGSNVCYMGGFSLRVAQEPRTKWIKGNDSTQTVRATEAIKPVTYVTKYNNIAGAETKLEWDGVAVDGITLKKIEGDLSDTLILNGTANAPDGEHQYAVVAYLNGKVITRAEGKFKVYYEIKAITDTDVDAEEGEAIDEIECRYYVYDEKKDIIFKWSNNVGIPGITTSAKDGIFTISGTPTKTDTCSYYITAEGCDTIYGTIRVESADLGENPVLYLYKNKTDYIYDYLIESGYNLKVKRAGKNLRKVDQYARYKWILISENVDANNPEAFQLMRGAHIPVLNMKAFSYSQTIDSLQDEYGYADPWGEADNGSISENGKSITVWRDDHPIFKALGKKQGETIQVLDSIVRRGLMPIKVTKTGGLCLATAWTRSREDYYGDGVQETFLHENPGLSGNDAKYISLPISTNSSQYLSEEGKKLLKATITYLLSKDASVARPKLKISQFKVLDKVGDIYEGADGKNTITLVIDSTLYPDTDWSKIVPEIEVASPYTYAVCEKCESDSIDLLIAQFIPIEYTVTDYIHRMNYDVKVMWRKAQGIEEVYEVGNWVNVYDIFGRKVATTNENIYTMNLPRGVYIIVTENGQTIKITR